MYLLKKKKKKFKPERVKRWVFSLPGQPRAQLPDRFRVDSIYSRLPDLPEPWNDTPDIMSCHLETLYILVERLWTHHPQHSYLKNSFSLLANTQSIFGFLHSSKKSPFIVYLNQANKIYRQIICHLSLFLVSFESITPVLCLCVYFYLFIIIFAY